MNRILVGVLALALAVGALVAVSAPARAETIEITWPEITAFNPHYTDYVIDVAYDGDENLYLSGGSESNPGASFVQLLSNGPNVAQIPDHHVTEDFHFYVSICPTEDPFSYQCRRVAQKRGIRVYTTLVTRISAPRKIYSSSSVSVDVPLPTPDGLVDVAWTVRAQSAPAGPPLVAGSATEVALPYALSPREWRDLVPHRTPLVLDVEVTDELAPFGELTGTDSMTFEWDRPTPPSLELSSEIAGVDQRDVDTFYPYPDGQSDDLTMHVRGELDLRSAEWTVKNATGDTVFFSAASYPVIYRYLTWDGEDSAGRMLPEGTYRVIVRARTSDGADHVLRHAVELSHARLEERVYRQTYTPKATLLDQRLGACGAIEIPARRGWPGSLGLRTDSACSEPRQRFAQTTHQLLLPAALGYSWIAAVSVHGAEAIDERVRSDCGTSEEPTDDLMIRFRSGGYGDPGAWEDWLVMPDGSAPTSIDAHLFGLSRRRPGLSWAARVECGDHFDIKSFDVQVAYVTFAD